MATFPSYVKLGWRDNAEKPTPVVARSEVERGVARQRRMAADSVVTVPVTAYFDTAADSLAFDSWFFGDAAAGAAWFDFTLPRTGAVVQARVVDGDIGQLKPATKNWAFSERTFQLEYIRPGFIELAPGLYTVDASRILSVQRSSVGTYVNDLGAVQAAAANVARYQGGQLLVEAAGVNMATRSASPAVYWAANGFTKGAEVMAPDGTTTAVPFLETNTGVAAGHQSTFASLNFEAGKRYVFSLFAAEVPGGQKRYAGVLLAAGVFGAAGQGVMFDMANGAPGVPLGSMTEFGSQPVAGGWRVWCAAVAESTGAQTAQMRLSTAINSVAQTYIGDTSSGMTLWGRQVEQLDAGGPTSFIYTTTAAAARAADLITVAA